MKQLRKRAKYLVLTLLSFFFLSCNYSGKLTRRYKTVNYSAQACQITNFVAVNASVPEKDPSGGPVVKALHELTGDGQKALINQLGTKEATSAGFLSKLKTDLAVPPDRSLPPVIDYTRFNKRILAAIRKMAITEGERIEKLHIRIHINDANLVFRNCNKLITEYMNVDLGKLNYSNSNALELSGNLGGGSEITGSDGGTDKQTSSSKNGDETLGSDRSTTTGLTNKTTASSGIAGKFTASRSFSEEVQLRQRLVALNAFVSGNDLFLYQEGISGIDLTGNILSDVTLEYLTNIRVDAVYSFDKLFTDAGAANPQNIIGLTQNLVKSPNITTDITAELRFEAVYRQIADGGRTITESDDRINLVNGSTMPAACSGSTFVVVPASSLRPNIWILNYAAAAPSIPLHITTSPGIGGDLKFLNYNNAVEFLRWLKAGVSSGAINLANPIAGQYRLTLGDNTTVPTPADIGRLRVELLVIP